MKALRFNKVLGLAIGEKSILVADVVAGEPSPDVRRLGEFVFPEGMSLADPAALGAALGEFLRKEKYASRNAVVGLPAKWLLVKTKEVPPAESSVAADLLRLQAEGDFSSELKDLVFDYAGESNMSEARNVLLVATPRKYVELARHLCEAARVEAAAVTSSAVALGTVTGHAKAGSSDAVVLTLTAGGSELTAQTGGHTSVLRHLRGPTPEPLFLNDLRRAMSMLPSNGREGGRNGGRELIVWDGSGSHATTLAESLGVRTREGDLPSLGVTAVEAARNGGGRKYAAAVALGMSALGERALPIDFLHSRLAAPERQLIKRWMVYAAVGLFALVAVSILGYRHLQKEQAALDVLTADYRTKEPAIKVAEAFVSKVTFAKKWYANDPRYAGCLNEITRLVPEDGLSYCTNLDIREKQISKAEATKNAAKAIAEPRTLVLTFFAKAPSQTAALQLKDSFQRDKSRFVDMKFNGTQNTGKAGEVTFSFTCTYVPPDVPVK